MGRAASLAAVEAAAADDKLVLLVAQRDGDVQEPAAADLFRTGVVARIHQLARLQNGTTKVLVEGIARARVTRYAPAQSHLRAAVSPEPLQPADVAPAADVTLAGVAPPGGERAPDLDVVRRRAVALFEEYVALHRRIPDEVATMVQGAAGPERQAFAIAAHLSVKHDARQRLLEVPSLAGLFAALADLLAGEVELLRLERKIEEDVRGSLFQNQREFYLQEQLKAIHKELGNEDGDDLADVEAQLRAKQLPPSVHERASRELRKLRRTSPLSPESTVGRNYLDWLLALPWRERTADVLDMAHAREVLDADHFGLVEVKERILDYIAVLALVGKLQGPIL